MNTIKYYNWTRLITLIVCIASTLLTQCNEPVVSKSTTNNINKLVVSSLDKDYDVPAFDAQNNATITVESEASLNGLVIKTLEIDSKATATPNQGEPLTVNGNKATIIVTAENGNIKTYTLQVNTPAKTFEISAFSIGDVQATINEQTISLELPWGSALEATPILEFGNNTSVENYQPQGAVTIKRNEPLTYTISSIDNQQKQYTVTIQSAPILTNQYLYISSSEFDYSLPSSQNHSSFYAILTATLKDQVSLPSWLAFDANSGKLTITATPLLQNVTSGKITVHFSATGGVDNSTTSITDSTTIILGEYKLQDLPKITVVPHMLSNANGSIPLYTILFFLKNSFQRGTLNVPNALTPENGYRVEILTEEGTNVPYIIPREELVKRMLPTFAPSSKIYIETENIPLSKVGTTERLYLKMTNVNESLPSVGYTDSISFSIQYGVIFHRSKIDFTRGTPRLSENSTNGYNQPALLVPLTTPAPLSFYDAGVAMNHPLPKEELIYSLQHTLTMRVTSALPDWLRLENDTLKGTPPADAVGKVFEFFIVASSALDNNNTTVDFSTSFAISASGNTPPRFLYTPYNENANPCTSLGNVLSTINYEDTEGDDVTVILSEQSTKNGFYADNKTSTTFDIKHRISFAEQQAQVNTIEMFLHDDRGGYSDLTYLRVFVNFASDLLFPSIGIKNVTVGQYFTFELAPPTLTCEPSTVKEPFDYGIRENVVPDWIQIKDGKYLTGTPPESARGTSITVPMDYLFNPIRALPNDKLATIVVAP